MTLTEILNSDEYYVLSFLVKAKRIPVEHIIDFLWKEGIKDNTLTWLRWVHELEIYPHSYFNVHEEELQSIKEITLHHRLAISLHPSKYKIYRVSKTPEPTTHIADIPSC